MIKIFTCNLKGFAIFRLIFVTEHTDVRIVTAGSQTTFVEGCPDSATRFILVETVGKTALMTNFKNVAEIVGYLGGLKIEGAETFHSGNIEPPPVGKV